VRLTLSNPNASKVSGTVRLLTSRKDVPVLGSAAYSLGPQGSARVAVTLGERARKIVRRKGQLYVRVKLPGRPAKTVLLRAAPVSGTQSRR
jgi:hypothetical protein